MEESFDEATSSDIIKCLLHSHNCEDCINENCFYSNFMAPENLGLCQLMAEISTKESTFGEEYLKKCLANNSDNPLTTHENLWTYPLCLNNNDSRLSAIFNYTEPLPSVPTPIGKINECDVAMKYGFDYEPDIFDTESIRKALQDVNIMLPLNFERQNPIDSSPRTTSPATNNNDDNGKFGKDSRNISRIDWTLVYLWTLFVVGIVLLLLAIGLSFLLLVRSLKSKSDIVKELR